jgi:hypothetical protein
VNCTALSESVTGPVAVIATAPCVWGPSTTQPCPGCNGIDSGAAAVKLPTPSSVAVNDERPVPDDGAADVDATGDEATGGKAADAEAGNEATDDAGPDDAGPDDSGADGRAEAETAADEIGDVDAVGVDASA